MNAPPFELKFADEVEEEIKEIVSWYSSRSTPSANKLIEAFDNLFEFLSVNPYSFSRQRKNFRIAYINKFPYAIVYEITGNYVLISRIIHTSRHPVRRFHKWRRK
jgi:plasmid stabilization system protein ParE